MAARARWARAGILVVSAASLLDFTTRLLPSPADHLAPFAPRPAWLVALQLALAVPVVVAALRGARPTLETLRALPIPRPAAWALGAFLSVAIVHVALRMERYPFSPVTMFSSAVPERRGEHVEAQGYAVRLPEGVEVISFLREGSPLFARHRFGWDYKAGWLMHMYGTTHRSAQDVVRRQLAAEGLPEPARIDYEHSRRDGRLRLPPGVTEAP